MRMILPLTIWLQKKFKFLHSFSSKSISYRKCTNSYVLKLHTILSYLTFFSYQLVNLVHLFIFLNLGIVFYDFNILLSYKIVLLLQNQIYRTRSIQGSLVSLPVYYCPSFSSSFLFP